MGRAFAAPSLVRSRSSRPLARSPPAQPGVHVHLGGCIYCHERHASSGRQPSRPVAAILAASLHGRASIRLSLPCRFGNDLLQSGVGLGLQRSGSHGYCPLPVGRGSEYSGGIGADFEPTGRSRRPTTCCSPFEVCRKVLESGSPHWTATTVWSIRLAVPPSTLRPVPSAASRLNSSRPASRASQRS